MQGEQFLSPHSKTRSKKPIQDRVKTIQKNILMQSSQSSNPTLTGKTYAIRLDFFQSRFYRECFNWTFHVFLHFGQKIFGINQVPNFLISCTVILKSIVPGLNGFFGKLTKKLCSQLLLKQLQIAFSVFLGVTLMFQVVLLLKLDC